jgi:hypothetical protein
MFLEMRLIEGVDLDTALKRGQAGQIVDKIVERINNQ